MQTKLVLQTKKAPFSFEKLANQVYITLKQVDNLFLELEFVSKQKIKKLNSQFRNIDKVTDVLSFPNLDNIKGKVLNKKDYPLDLTEDGKAIFIGSIAVCTKRAEEQAKEYGHSIEREVTYLVCHGILHLMGYDHIDESDKIEMRKTEEEIMSKIEVTR